MVVAHDAFAPEVKSAHFADYPAWTRIMRKQAAVGRINQIPFPAPEYRRHDSSRQARHDSLRSLENG